MVLLGTTIAMASFCLTLLLPSLYMPIREVLQPWAVSRVEREHEWLVWLQQWHHPVLTHVFKFIGHTIGVAFYITFLPFLFWIGEMRLASSPLPSLWVYLACRIVWLPAACSF